MRYWRVVIVNVSVDAANMECNMKKPVWETVALVGMGVIGKGWMRVFCDAGCKVHIYDANADQVAKALAWLERSINRDIQEGFITAERGQKSLGFVKGHERLDEALVEAQYVQESCPEQLAHKQVIFAELDEIARPEAVIASSTSGLNINDIARDLKGVARCIMAHPFNPSYVLPVVEVLPTDHTDPMVTKQTIDFLTGIGQVPIVMKKYVRGFIGNRIQAAVVREAIHLVLDGVADVAAVDAMMCHGLGLRWALMGSFEVNHTNADGGIREYYGNFKDAYTSWMLDLNSQPPSFTPEMIELFARGVADMLGQADIEDICAWRDRMVRGIRQLKEKDPHP